MLEEGGVGLEEKTVKEAGYEIQSVENKEEIKHNTYHCRHCHRHRVLPPPPFLLLE